MTVDQWRRGYCKKGFSKFSIVRIQVQKQENFCDQVIKTTIFFTFKNLDVQDFVHSKILFISRDYPISFVFNHLVMYHRERIYFSSTLSCNQKEEKNHQTFQWGHEPSANQVSNKGAPFWKGRTPQQPSKQLPTISTLQLNFPPPHHVAWDLLLLPAPTADSYPLFTPRPCGTTYPSSPF